VSETEATYSTVADVQRLADIRTCLSTGENASPSCQDCNEHFLLARLDAANQRIADLERENVRLEGWGQNTMDGCLAILVKAQAAISRTLAAVGCGPGASDLLDEIDEAVRQLSAGKPSAGVRCDTRDV
jgi:hypothetical protein